VVGTEAGYQFLTLNSPELICCPEKVTESALQINQLFINTFFEPGLYVLLVHEEKTIKVNTTASVENKERSDFTACFIYGYTKNSHSENTKIYIF